MDGSPFMLTAIVNTFKNFRDKIFSCFSYRADATMELLDALAGNVNADSVVGLSENPAFRRGYGSIHDVISHFDQDPNQSERIEQRLLHYCSPITEAQPFHLMVLDCTSAPRPHSKTLQDKGVVYSPNPIPGNKPITIGHQYSVMGFLPEQASAHKNPPWILPISVRRVATDTNGINVGIEQMTMAASHFKGDLSVFLGDVSYSKPAFIKSIQENNNALLIARLTSNRIINRKPIEKICKTGNRRKRGHELWYGTEFNFKKETTWGDPHEIMSTPFITRKGKIFTARIQCWNDLLMRQKQGIKLNEYPFRVIRIEIFDEKENIVFNRPMWLMISGKRQHELNLTQIWKSYQRRYDIEHFFRFGKSRLLLDKFQTPDTAHEESWWKIACLSYAQLYMARELASNMPAPWEKYLPAMKTNETVKSVRQVQKSFNRITTETGTPAVAPKARGKQLGRQKGVRPMRRMRHTVIVKGSKWQKEKLQV